MVGILFRLIELLIIALPLAGAIFAAVKAFQRATRRDEQPPAQLDQPAPAPVARDLTAGLWRTITKTVEAHARTDERWLSYELDVATLLDFPLMTDMRDPLVIRFHKAKLRADVLRPARAEDLLDDRPAAESYLEAVEDYVTAFDAAEAESMLRRRNDFSRDDQQRIARAQGLLRVASDASATPNERAQSYRVAQHELEGIIVLPVGARAAIERVIAGELDG